MPLPLPAQSVDLSNVKIAPGVSARDIFRQHSANLANIIATDPIRFAGEFAAVCLISSTLVGSLNSQHALTALEKATKLVTALHTNLKVDNNPKLLLKICEVLKKQQMPVLDNIVVKMLQQLGKQKSQCNSLSILLLQTNFQKPTFYNILTSGGLDTAATPVPPITSDTGIKPIIPTTTKEDSSTTKSKGMPLIDAIHCYNPSDVHSTLAAEIKSLLSGKTSANAENLRKIFDRNMEEIVDNLYSARVISQSRVMDPSYDAIMEEFLNTLQFLDDDKQLAYHCGKFLKVLISIGGPTKICGEWIKREIEKIGLEISLDNTLDHFFQHSIGTALDTASVPIPPNPATVTPESKLCFVC